MKTISKLKKYSPSIIMFALFEAIAITLWLTLDNIFYLFNFTYIGGFIAVGVFLYIRKYKHARLVVQLGVGIYMLVYLGLIEGENMQIEGFWFYLFSGVFEAATIHYVVAKIFGPLFLEGDGVDTPAGRQWYSTFFHINSRKAQGRKALGIFVLYHLQYHWFLWRCCF